jgi:holo-ACP synthase / triphosphoribosyl-dephospho-CoA synthase
MTITLEQLLAAKEERQERRNKLRKLYGTAVASITLNIPGPVKDSPLLRQLCDYAAEALQAVLEIAAMERINPATGPVAILAIRAAAARIKEIAIGIEEEEAFSRLLDIDVFDPDGHQLSRQDCGSHRFCLLCERPAVVCIRENSHSADEIQTAVQSLLTQFLAFRTRRNFPD